MKQKDIKYKLKKIQQEEEILKKIDKFLTTKRGIKFVSMLHRMPLRELCRAFNAQFMLHYDSDTRNMNLIKSSIQKNKIVPITSQTIARKAPPRIRYQIRLTRAQIAEMTAQNKPKRLGFAALMHAYEEHKMRKFEKKNPGPTERELAEDLFPKALEIQYKTQQYIHREYVRNFLSRTYGKVNIREPFYRVFLVYEGPDGQVMYEKEGDPVVIGYPFAGKNQFTRLDVIKDILRSRAKTIKDKDCIEIKVYNKYGKLLSSCRTN